MQDLWWVTKNLQDAGAQSYCLSQPQPIADFWIVSAGFPLQLWLDKVSVLKRASKPAYLIHIWRGWRIHLCSLHIHPSQNVMKQLNRFIYLFLITKLGNSLPLVPLMEVNYLPSWQFTCYVLLPCTFFSWKHLSINKGRWKGVSVSRQGTWRSM